MTLRVGRPFHRAFWLFSCTMLALQVPTSVFAAPSQFYSGNGVLFYTDGVPCSEGEGAESSPSGSAPGSVTVPKDFTLGNDAGKRPVNLVKQLMQDFNFKDFQAAGIVGNFMQESGGKNLPPNVNQYGQAGDGPGPPTPVFTSGHAYGWAQWDGGRKQAFVDYNVENGYMKNANVSATDAANYAYLTFEMTETSESKVVPAVKQTTDVSSAVATWEAEFERAGKPVIDVRIKYGKEVLNAYKSGGGVNVDGDTDGGSQDSGSSEEESQDCQMPESTSPTTASGTFGEVAFPIKGNKSVVTGPEGIFSNGTTSQGSHPYIAYDIYTGTTPDALAFASGTVTGNSSDVCGGQLLTIWNEKAKLGVTYMHLSQRLPVGQKVSAGDRIGKIGPADLGCGTEHLHMDAATDRVRQGCSRASCPIEDHFRDIGKDLFTTYQALPD